MLVSVVVTLLTVNAVLAADLCSSRYGGLCSYSSCSRYYLPPSENVQLCPSYYQRCCVTGASDRCVQHGGYCQSRTSYCGLDNWFTHDSANNPLCSVTSQRCCIPKAGTVTIKTTPKPIELCVANYRGTCQRSYDACAGNWYTHTGNTRLCHSSSDVCCIATKTTSAPLTPVPTSRPSTSNPCRAAGGVCQLYKTTTCVGGTHQLINKNFQFMCDDISNYRCCVPSPSGVSKQPTTKASRITTVSPPAASCGKSKIAGSTRVVGGQPAERGEWPWQVSIVKSTSSRGTYFSHSCGGTLINSQWVVSAAHCFKGLSSLYSIRVRVGEHSFYVDENSEQNARVANIIAHPYYSQSSNRNDIALLKLSSPVNLNDKYIGAACTPQMSQLSDFYNTKECYTTGWGLTQGYQDRNVLQEVQSTLVSKSSCYSKWGYKIDDSKVCFGNGVRGSCKGDSGGPLVCRNNGAFYLVGVVSYGTPSCTVINTPTVYTNVAYYQDWISETMKKN